MKKTATVRKILMITAMISLFSMSAFAADMITAADAQNAALKTVPGKILETKLHSKKHGLTYEVKIFDGSGISKLEINAISGTLVDRKWESTRPEKAAAFNSAKISHDQALKTALQEVPGAVVKKAELKVHGGKPVFKIEMLDSRGIRQDAYINAVDGKLILLRQDKVIIGTPSVSLAQAKETTLSNMPGATVIFAELEEDDDDLQYKVDVISGNIIYEVRINALTGSVLRMKEK